MNQEAAGGQFRVCPHMSLGGGDPQDSLVFMGPRALGITF